MIETIERSDFPSLLSLDSIALPALSSALSEIAGLLIMASVFHLQAARRRNWELAGAIILSIAFASYIAVAIQDPRRSLFAIIFGVAAILKWMQWSRLPKLPGTRIELDDSGIRFYPADYWQMSHITWAELTGMNIERQAIWLLYHKNGAEKTRDIPRSDLSFEDYSEMVTEIRERLRSRTPD